MVGTLLVRGMLVGIVAGLLSFGFLKVYGEPQVDRSDNCGRGLPEAEISGALLTVFSSGWWPLSGIAGFAR